MRELDSIREKILDKTLYLVSHKGSYDVSVRDITQAAGVNVNAVNYYFGSKDQLLEEMEAFFVENYLAAYAVLDQELEDEEKLFLFANEVMEYTLSYPGIPFIFRSKLETEEEGIIKRFLDNQATPLSDRIDLLLTSVFGVRGAERQMLRIVFDAALVAPVSLGTGYQFDTAELTDVAVRHHYIRFLIRTLKGGIHR